MNTLEGIIWFVFFVTVCLLFFAAFSSDRVTGQTIEEYMDNLMADENQDWGNGKRGT
tara:strand:+ start:6095 stop:6265 length:171 start_codon:yes stop_codon:yes gene_type:complete